MNPLEGLKETVRAQTREIMIEALKGLGDVIVDLSYSIALVGGGLTLILSIAGWEQGKRWTGILAVGYVLIKLLLG